MGRVDKRVKIIGAISIGICDFIFGLNVMYCIAYPEVGLWRIPVMAIGFIALNILSLPIITANDLAKEES